MKRNDNEMMTPPMTIKQLHLQWQRIQNDNGNEWQWNQITMKQNDNEVMTPPMTTKQNDNEMMTSATTMKQNDNETK